MAGWLLPHAGAFRHHVSCAALFYAVPCCMTVLQGPTAAEEVNNFKQGSVWKLLIASYEVRLAAARSRRCGWLLHVHAWQVSYALKLCHYCCGLHRPANAVEVTHRRV